MGKKDESITVRIPRKTKKRLLQVAKQVYDRSYAWLVNKYLDEKLSQEPPTKDE